MMELCSRRDFASNQRQAWCPVIFKRSLPWRETAGAGRVSLQFGQAQILIIMVALICYSSPLTFGVR